MEQIQGAMGRGRGRGRPILSANSKSMENQQYSPRSQATENYVKSLEFESVSEQSTTELNEKSFMNVLKSRLSESSKPFVRSDSFGHHEQRKVVDANNNIRVTIKKQPKKTKPRFYSTQVDDDEEDLCPVCDRPTGNIMCTSCKSVWRVSISSYFFF
jgi:hypothetical protein